MVALYAELDEKADYLRRADELKSRFLSNMSHEFRSPLNSILALSGLLLGRTDGELTAEQAQQVGYVRRAAQDLLELVNDLLDLAKVEAGKVEVKPVEFEAVNLFAALRGMLRPLLLNQSVDLIFEPVDHLPRMYLRRGKDLADSPQLHLQFAEIYRARRDTGIGLARRQWRGPLCGLRHRNRHRARRPGPDLSGFRTGRSSHSEARSRHRPRTAAFQKARRAAGRTSHGGKSARRRIGICAASTHSLPR